jgi:hypothetical protein
MPNAWLCHQWHPHRIDGRWYPYAHILAAGNGPKPMHSKGSRSKKQLAQHAASINSEQATEQPDLIAAVNSSSSTQQQQQQQQQQEGLQEQEGQVQQQQQPYELQMQEGE